MSARLRREGGIRNEERGCAVPNAPEHPSLDPQARLVQQYPAPVCQPCTPGAPLPTRRLSSQPSPGSSCAPSSLRTAHGELSSPAPAPCGPTARSKSSCRDPVRQISFQGFSSVRTSSDGRLCPKDTFPLCLFIPILMETLTLGNHWGNANDDHVCDGPPARGHRSSLGARPAKINPCPPHASLGDIQEQCGSLTRCCWICHTSYQETEE